MEKKQKELVEKAAQIFAKHRQLRRCLWPNIQLIDVQMLMLLYAKGAKSTKQLALELDIYEAKISRAVAKMVEQGMLNKSVNKEDRRVYHVSLTPWASKSLEYYLTR